ncbi:hypothetical protein ACHAW5_007848 [Stephanodiscus triporus]|uniref:Dynamin-type G domain-containing protein n=1 Tax=Stephanodiscus triporus TaxID=2934178 RepID=A0ABD3QD42_9STRA
MVLLIGQYSTGKTTFLNHLLGEDFPGMHIGPEPTTDKFMALFHDGDRAGVPNDVIDATAAPTGFRRRNKSSIDDDDDDDDDGSTARSVVTDDVRTSGRLVKGNTLTVTPNLPFSSLSQFGSAFLNHFVGSSSGAPLLRRITFIDTPGVLSGEKQRINRTYDFGQVAKWFADRSDLILLLFDAHKLDISDEFKNVLDTIRLHNVDKIRCVLNKADCVTREQLVRVYGSLLWSMGKIFDSPEVVRVYLGSFWNGALINDDFKRMFDKDEKLLVRELVDLPRCAAERKVNQMVNRIRLVKVHVCLLGALSKMTPRLFGKRRSRAKILDDLDSIMDNVRVEFDLSKGDMPDPEEFARCLKNFPDFGVFPPTDRNLIENLDSLIERDIPNIISEADFVRMGQRVVVREQEKNEPVDPVTVVGAAALPPPPGGTARGPWVVLLGKFVFFCLLTLSIAEGVHLWSFSRPAYSLIELHDGCRYLVNFALDRPEYSEVRSKLEFFFHRVSDVQSNVIFHRGPSSESYDQDDVPSEPPTTPPDAGSEL